MKKLLHGLLLSSILLVTTAHAMEPAVQPRNNNNYFKAALTVFAAAVGIFGIGFLFYEFDWFKNLFIARPQPQPAPAPNPAPQQNPAPQPAPAPAPNPGNRHGQNEPSPEEEVRRALFSELATYARYARDGNEGQQPVENYFETVREQFLPEDAARITALLVKKEYGTLYNACLAETEEE